jgi:hypothetical protein
MRTWALLPRIFRFRSAPKPPMIATTMHSANELTPTPAIDSTLMTVKKPLLCARTWRAATNETNPRPSTRLSAHGTASTIVPITKKTPLSTAPTRTTWCQSTK